MAGIALCLIYHSLPDASVSVHAPISQERPVSSLSLDQAEVDLMDEDRFLIDSGAGNDGTIRGGDKTLSPKIEARPSRGSLVADAI